MLTIRCSACKRKLWKYDKIGKGEVLRCHKRRITKVYDFKQLDGQVQCPCGRAIGIDKGSYVKMHGRAFTCSGTKRTG